MPARVAVGEQILQAILERRSNTYRLDLNVNGYRGGLIESGRIRTLRVVPVEAEGPQGQEQFPARIGFDEFLIGSEIRGATVFADSVPEHVTRLQGQTLDVPVAGGEQHDTVSGVDVEPDRYPRSCGSAKSTRGPLGRMPGGRDP